MFMPAANAEERLAARGDTFVPQSEVRLYIGVFASTTLFATFFFAARVYSQAVARRVWKIDDTILSLAWAGSVMWTVFMSMIVYYNWGPNCPVDSVKHATLLDRISTAQATIWYAALPLVKLSICFFYLRIFSAEVWIRRSIIACAVFIVAYYIPCYTAFEVINKWYPQEAMVTRQELKSWDDRFYFPVFFAYGCSSTLSDIWILVTILPRILRLQVRPQEKKAIFLIFSIGWFDVAISLVRLVRTAQLMAAVLDLFPWQEDEYLIWKCVELNVAIFCAAAPTISPLLRKCTAAERRKRRQRRAVGVSPEDGMADGGRAAAAASPFGPGLAQQAAPIARPHRPHFQLTSLGATDLASTKAESTRRSSDMDLRLLEVEELEMREKSLGALVAEGRGRGHGDGLIGDGMA